jgi:DNA-binding NarL/FixJ family response regulator
MALAGVVPSGENTSLLLEREAEGMTNEEIAQTLFVTIKTVEVHLSHAYRKLEINSRAQLDKVLLTPAPSQAPVSA